MASSLPVVHPTTLRHLLSRTFCSPRPFSSTTPVVSVHCLFSSSSSAPMTSSSKTTMKSTSSQTNTTVLLYKPHSLKAAILKTLALKIGNELNNGTIAPSTRQHFSTIMFTFFFLSSKKITFEQYYRLHVSGPTVAICEIKSNNVFVLTHSSFDQNNFYFLHAVQEAVDAFIAVLCGFLFKNWLRMTRPNILLSQILLPILKSSNLIYCRSFVILVEVFNLVHLLVAASSSSSIFPHLYFLRVAVSSSSQTSLSSLRLLLADPSP